MLPLISTSDSSYDAVRRTGWSNNMHSGKGENTVIIRSFIFVWKTMYDRAGTPNMGNFIIQYTLKHKACMWKCRFLVTCA